MSLVATNCVWGSGCRSVFPATNVHFGSDNSYCYGVAAITVTVYGVAATTVTVYGVAATTATVYGVAATTATVYGVAATTATVYGLSLIHI